MMSPNMRLRPGNGVLVRHEDLVLLCELPLDEEDCVRSILAEVKAAAGGDQPGDRLVRHLVKSLAASGDRFPSLCAFGAVEDGIAFAVHGKARLRVTTMDGEMRLDGRDAVTILDRVISGQVTSITGEIGEEIPGFCSWSELTAGVVRADALHYGESAEPEVMMMTGAAVMTEESMAPEESMAAGEPVATDEPVAVAVEEPVAVEETAASEEVPVAEELVHQPEDGSQILGVSCAKGHFNDPDNQYCALCGIGLTQAGRRATQQGRPPLGVLVLDDGTSLPLTKDYVIGRSPESASDVGADDVTLVRLTDPLVSGVHARVRLEGWEVRLFDEGSSNGTFVRESGSDWCTRVPSGGRVVLRPGSIVTVGHRQFRYDSYRRQ
jgi:hypothetical protein